MRYIGKNLYVAFAGVVLTGDWMQFEVLRQVDWVDVTALGEPHQVLRPTTSGGTWRLRVIDEAGAYGSGTAWAQTLTIGDSGELVFGPLGHAVGQPKFSFPAIITAITHPFIPNEEAQIVIEGRINGAWVADVFGP